MIQNSTKDRQWGIGKSVEFGGTELCVQRLACRANRASAGGFLSRLMSSMILGAQDQGVCERRRSAARGATSRRRRRRVARDPARRQRRVRRLARTVAARPPRLSRQRRRAARRPFTRRLRPWSVCHVATGPKFHDSSFLKLVQHHPRDILADTHDLLRTSSRGSAM